MIALSGGCKTLITEGTSSYQEKEPPPLRVKGVDAHIKYSECISYKCSEGTFAFQVQRGPPLGKGCPY
eukprot:c10859_g1_i1 orf=1-201(-)